VRIIQIDKDEDIPGTGSQVTAASRAATGKKLETFMLATEK
jgi:hypothetical protein